MGRGVAVATPRRRSLGGPREGDPRSDGGESRLLGERSVVGGGRYTLGISGVASCEKGLVEEKRPGEMSVDNQWWWMWCVVQLLSVNKCEPRQE